MVGRKLGLSAALFCMSAPGIWAQVAEDEAAMARDEQVLAAEPGNKEAAADEVANAVRMALAARAAGQNDQALGYLLRARKSVPADPTLLLDFGIQAEAMRLYRDADEALTEADRLRPNDANTLYALGRIKLDEGRSEDAERYLRRYLALKPDDASAHYGLGRLLHMELRDEDARAELERSIALRPAQTEAYYVLGDIALAQHKDEEAVREFAVALGRDPNHAGALAGLGTLAYRRKDYPKAVELLRHSLSVAPEHPETHRTLAQALAKLGRERESADELAAAQKLTEQQDRERRGFVLQKTP